MNRHLTSFSSLLLGTVLRGTCIHGPRLVCVGRSVAAICSNTRAPPEVLLWALYPPQLCLQLPLQVLITNGIINQIFRRLISGRIATRQNQTPPPPSHTHHHHRGGGMELFWFRATQRYEEGEFGSLPNWRSFHYWLGDQVHGARLYPPGYPPSWKTSIRGDNP